MKTSETLRNWIQMLLEDDQLFENIKTHPKKEIQLFRMEGPDTHSIIPKTDPIQLKSNGCIWSLSPQGTLSVQNQGIAYAEPMLSDTLYWNIHSYDNDRFYFPNGVLPASFLAKESYLHMLSPEGYVPCNDKQKNYDGLLQTQPAYIKNQLWTSHPQLLANSCVVRWPDMIYGLKSGMKAEDPIKYYVYPRHLVSDYTSDYAAKDQCLLSFHWNGEKYVHQTIFENDKMDTDQILSVDPDIIYLMNLELDICHNRNWAKNYWEYGCWHINFAIKRQLQQEKFRILNNIVFLQNKLEEYWNEIMAEMGLPVEEVSKFDESVCLWEFIEQSPLHTAWLAYDEKSSGSIDLTGQFCLYFPSEVFSILRKAPQFKDLRDFCKSFYNFFSKMLIKKDLIEFGFKITRVYGIDGF